VEDSRKSKLRTIIGKTASRLGAPNVRLAKMLAAEAVRQGISKQRFYQGYLLRGVKVGTMWMGQVIDPPSYLWLSGPAQLGAPGNVNAVGFAVSVGNRDDFVDPGTRPDTPLTGKNKSAYLLVASPSMNVPPSASSMDWHMRSYQDGPFMEHGYMLQYGHAAPPSDTQWWFDDADYFNYGDNVAIACTIQLFKNTSRLITFQDTGGITYGALSYGYFLRNQFAVSENDLPDAWRFAPRRLVPVAQSEFPNRENPGDTMPGFAIAAGGDELAMDVTDDYCIAARTFRQDSTLWPVEEDKTGFDRYGEQGMAIALGSLDRAEWDASSLPNLFATLDSMVVLDGFSILEEYIQPFPATRRPEGGPTLPNFGVFNTPSPVRVADGFVVFSSYYTTRDLNPVGTEDPDETIKGTLTSILFTGTDLVTTGLKADWDVPSETVPTGTIGQATYPYIMGTLSLLEGESDSQVRAAYCLVWEANYSRRDTGSINAIGGNWALYRSEGKTVTRTVIEGGAALMAYLMYQGRGYPSRTGYDYATVANAMYWMGGRKVVFAGTDASPTSENVVRSIRPLILDLDKLAITVGGEITKTVTLDDKCIITVAQQEQLDSTGVVTGKASLLASVTRDKLHNWGAGKTYISVDSGVTWRLYMSDLAGQNGAFLEGNKLWQYDQNKPIT
jgi:hypothetical protein